MDKQHLLSLVVDDVKGGVHARHHMRVIWKNSAEAGDFDKEILGIQRQWQTDRWFFAARDGSKIYTLKQLLRLEFGSLPVSIDVLTSTRTVEDMRADQAIEWTYLGSTKLFL